jgi:hypothetical protein
MEVHEVIRFWNMLDDLGVECEEARNVDQVTLDNYKDINRGNSSMHYILTENNHRIVLQIHKNGVRKGKVDVVQGDPSSEIGLEDLVDLINSDPATYTDARLNKLFIQYWNIWQTCTSWYETEMDCFLWEFGPKMSIWYNNFMWYLNVNDATVEEMTILQNFIDAINDICRGR